MSRSALVRVVTVIGLFLAVAAGQMFAQINAASLSGTIVDPSGASVADAEVVARNFLTNTDFRTVSNANGYYVFPRLEIGSYGITVEKDGFSKVTSSILLEVGDRARLDFAMQLGTRAVSVEVKATTPLLSTQDASTGAVIDNRSILDLPLATRNWDDLMIQVPGVQGDKYTEQSGGTAAGRTGAVNVHGVRSLQNNFILDGVDNNSISENVQELSTQVARPSVDTIQEFKITTAPYSAEYGRSPGGAVSVTTKSGTNNYHGTLYEFHRNRIFDATDYFLKRSGGEKGQHIQNQFGANFGGPILKSKMFFFGNYEGTRIRKGVTRLGNVPTAGERIGDFSLAAAQANGIQPTASNPFGYATLIDRVGDCVGAGNPFPNNQIPASCIDPVAANVLSMVPGPNTTPASGALNANNFLRVPSILDDTDSYTGRYDWNVAQNHNLFVRYTYVDRSRFVPGVFGGILDGTSTSAFGRMNMKGQSLSIGFNSTFGRMLNEFRMGFAKNNSEAEQEPFGQNTLAELGFLGVPDDPLYSGGIPGLVISSRGGTALVGSGQGGLDRLGSPDFLPKFQKTTQFQWADTVSVPIKRHLLKFGADFRAPLHNQFLDVPSLRGTYNFDGNRTGVGVADFLLGYPSQVQVATPTVVEARFWMMSYFVQDEWRVTDRLSLNLGLRYDFATPPYEASNRISNFDAATGTIVTPDTSPYGKYLVELDKNNWAPRIGAAYKLTEKTVVRGGYGRFYQLLERAGSEDQLGLNLPWLVQNAVAATSNSATANNVRLSTGFNLSLDPAAVNPLAVRIRAVDPNHAEAPSIDQWSLGVQQELPGNLIFTTDYVGTTGRNLSQLLNANQVILDANGAPIPNQYPYPELGGIEMRRNLAVSNYHGLETSVERRFGTGLGFRVSYTFSKSLDEAMEHLFGGGSSSFLQNSADPGTNYGRSDFDYRHRFVSAVNYELPFGRGRQFLQEGLLSWIIGGWRTSTIVNLHTGRPFTVFANANNTALGGRGGMVTAFADCLGDGTLDDGTVDRWFDTTQYARPDPARLGTCGRNTLDAPGYANVDFSLARTFPLPGEGRNVEFRWEAFNLFNTPQFGVPDHNISGSNVGKITTLAGDPRVMQFALKLYF